ncbi:MAG: phosphotransferase [Bacilli bacterium]|nr:phosphotransferase [Bacilli bacterium]
MNIKSNLKDDVLHIILEGQIDSTNAPQVEKDLFGLIPASGFNRIELDCEKLEYVTSAGLRVILALWKRFPSLALIDVIPAVYEILEMTGFSQMMEVHKVLRRISVDGCPIIGEGFTATVYRLDADTIVKVFKTARSMDKIQAEIDAAKQAFIYGIPTAISYDVVKVGEFYGVVFEMLDCASLRDLIVAHPDKFDEYKKMYADLSYKITHTDASGSGLGECKPPMLEKLSVLSSALTPEEYQRFMAMVEAIPDTGTLTHGDFHIKNILVQNGEPVLIDMDAVSLGNPIFELEGIYMAYISYTEVNPANAEEFFGVTQEVLDGLFDALIERYYGTEPLEKQQRIRDKIALLATAHLAYQTIYYKRDKNGRLNTAIARFRELFARVEDLDLSK